MTIANESGGKIPGYQGDGGHVSWCNTCNGRGNVGHHPADASRCVTCEGTGSYRFPPANVAMDGLREEFGANFDGVDPMGLRGGNEQEDGAQEDGAREGVQRYIGNRFAPGLTTDPNGDWVWYEDHMAEVARLKEERDRLLHSCESMRGEIKRRGAVIREVTVELGCLRRSLGDARDGNAGRDGMILALEGELEQARAELAASSILIDTLRQDVAKAVAHGEGVRGELAEARSLLHALVDGAEVYSQPEDGTRQWCSELSTYLRGNVALSCMITKDEKAKLDAFLSDGGGCK